MRSNCRYSIDEIVLSHRRPRSETSIGVRTNYASLVRALPPDNLEEFFNYWLEQRVKGCHSHELWLGTGDMDRDVTGYVTDQRMEGLWDTFQCKQLSSSLKESSAFIEEQRRALQILI